MFSKILIANRGEIAVRIIKTARRLGIGTVVVYSDADRDSLAVEMADESVAIGPAPAAESYLVMDKIVAAARKVKADAIHPGFGFLSEKAEFAERLLKEKITFIGPNPGAIRAMGDKIESKRTAGAANVSTGLHWRDRGREARDPDRRGDRLSGHDQGERGGRGQGHPRCGQPQGSAGRLPRGGGRGQGRIRR
jgi:acetyl/propionyl-CoA carboxylase alpha subunit